MSSHMSRVSVRMSEGSVYSRYNIRVAFRSCPTLRSNLTRVKDVLPTGLHSKVVYQIPCMCGKVYIGETVRRLDTRVNEILEACKRGETSKSAVAEHAWDCQQPIMWNDTTILDRARGQLELRVKEAFHIQLRPNHEHVNRDVGLELPGCWISTLKAAMRH